MTWMALAVAPTMRCSTQRALLCWPLTRLFRLHLVKDGPVSHDLGKTLNRALEIRLVADYKGESVELDDAREMIEQAEVFVEAMRAEFIPDFRPETKSDNGMES